MKDTVDRYIQLAALLTTWAWVSILIASKVPYATVLFFYLSISLIAVWILDTFWHLLATRRAFQRLSSRVISPYLTAMLIMVIIAAFMLSNTYFNMTFALATPTQLPEDASAELTLLPHIAVIFIMTILLLTSATARNVYRTRLKRALRRVG